MNAKPKILFLCTGNSCRSQMAEGWARKLRAEDMEVWSAGVKPKAVDSRAVRAMAEVGVDITEHKSKDVRGLMDVQFDYVVTLCGHAHETCPVFPGKTRVVHQGFEDPPLLARDAGSDDEAMAHYRRVRDEIREFVLGLPGNLVQEHEGLYLDLDLNKKP